MAILAAKDVVVSYYGDISVLEGVSFEAEPGRITVIIGPNGAGKSTLLKTLYGLLRPRSGSLSFDGHDLTRLKVHQFMELGLAYVPQARSIFPGLKVVENLELGCWKFRKDKARVRSALDKVFAAFPMLQPRADERAGDLSGGMQKILEVGRAMLTDPRVLLLDEPTATLAPLVAKEIYTFLQRMREQDMTVVLVDQNVRQALEIADQVYVLELGRNRASGARAEFEGRLKEVVQDWLS